MLEKKTGLHISKVGWKIKHILRPLHAPHFVLLFLFLFILRGKVFVKLVQSCAGKMLSVLSVWNCTRFALTSFRYTQMSFTINNERRHYW